MFGGPRDVCRQLYKRDETNKRMFAKSRNRTLDSQSVDAKFNEVPDSTANDLFQFEQSNHANGI